MSTERLQRVLSSRGIASRRRAEELILEGRVRVDGVVIRELGTKVDPETAKIEVDGNLIPNQRRRYILLNKPKGYITTTDDERGRDTVMDLVRVEGRVVPVGRLDRQTEGLLLFTNDGEVAHRVMHPRFEIDKEYEALLDGFPPPEALDRLRRGIVVDGERAKPSVVRPLRNTEDGLVVRVVLHEGRNRIVRRMFEEIGFPVTRLIRMRIGPLQLGNIPRGQYRDLTDGELLQLREAVGLTDEDVANEEGLFRTRGTPDRNPRPRRPDDRGGPRGGRPEQRGPSRPGQRPDRERGPEQRGPGRFPSRPGRELDRDDRTERPFRRDSDQRPGGPGRPARRDPAERSGERPERGGQRRDFDRTDSGPRGPRGGPEDRRGPRPERPQGGPRDRRAFTEPAESGKPARSGPPRGPARPDRRDGPGRPPGGPIKRTGPRRDTGPRNERQDEGAPGGQRDGGRGRSGGGERNNDQGRRGGSPPVHDRDRRSGGGGEEHGRRNRRPPA